MFDHVSIQTQEQFAGSAAVQDSRFKIQDFIFLYGPFWGNEEHKKEKQHKK